MSIMNDINGTLDIVNKFQGIDAAKGNTIIGSGDLAIDTKNISEIRLVLIALWKKIMNSDSADADELKIYIGK